MYMERTSSLAITHYFRLTSRTSYARRFVLVYAQALIANERFINSFGRRETACAKIDFVEGWEVELFARGYVGQEDGK